MALSADAQQDAVDETAGGFISSARHGARRFVDAQQDAVDETAGGFISSASAEAIATALRDAAVKAALGTARGPHRPLEGAGALPSAHRGASGSSPLSSRASSRRTSSRESSPRRDERSDSLNRTSPRRDERSEPGTSAAAARDAGEALRVENAELRRRATALETALQNRQATLDTAFRTRQATLETALEAAAATGSAVSSAHLGGERSISPTELAMSPTAAKTADASDELTRLTAGRGQRAPPWRRDEIAKAAGGGGGSCGVHGVAGGTAGWG
jgi:hypothetical protein